MDRTVLGRSDGTSDERTLVNDYDALRDYLLRQKQEEFVLSFEQIEEIIGAALPRAAQRASWWDSLRSPDIQMPQREACLAAGFVATRMPDGASVRFRKQKGDRRR
ncbi:hypothetical protein EHH60_09425 [Bradyrhizobium sp. RP6]|nr:hypothetical protein EHH60_09425 [Bradyrhizobium sp. RP6]